jgi:hypothetical protein
MVSHCLSANPRDESSAAGKSVEQLADVVRLPGPRFRLLDALGQGQLGPTWRARLDDGSVVIVKQLRLTSSERSMPAGGPYLVPQTIVWRRGQPWAVTEGGEAVPLDRLPARQRRAFVVLIGLGILNGLARLHQDRLWHGSLKPSNVLIGREGSVRLTHYALTEVDGEKEYAAARLSDVRAAGAILCRLMGISVEGRGSSRAAESPIGTAARAIATMGRQQRPGYEATHACVVLWEAAGRLGSARSQAQAAAQLGAAVARVSGEPSNGSLPPSPDRAAAPAAPAGSAPRARGSSRPPVPTAPGPRQSAGAAADVHTSPQRRRSRPADWILGLGVVAVAAGLVALLSPAAGVSPIVSHPAAVSPGALAASSVPSPEPSAVGDSQLQAAPAPTPAPTVTTVEAPLPAPAAPAAAGDVNWVSLSARGPCTAEQWCQLEVRAGLMPTAQPRDVNWQVLAPDPCGTGWRVVAAGSVRAQPRWTLVVDTAVVAVPDSTWPLLEAVVLTPDRAASTFLRLASASC